MKKPPKYLYEAPNGRFVSRQRIYQIRNDLEGLCIICRKPQATKQLCLEHAIQRREFARKKTGAKKRINSITYRLSK